MVSILLRMAYWAALDVTTRLCETLSAWHAFSLIGGVELHARRKHLFCSKMRPSTPACYDEAKANSRTGAEETV